MDKAMEVVKKNLVSIICGVVAIIAILAVFWPISGMFEDLQQRATSRAGVYNQLRDLSNKERYLPKVSLREDVQPARLEQFPTERVIERGTKVTEQLEAEAKAIFEAAVRLNRGDKKPLVADVLPRPRNNNVILTFQREYLREMDYNNPDPARRAQSMPMREMQAGLRPTDAEIKSESARIERAIISNELQHDTRGKPINEPQVKAKIAAELAEVGPRLRSDVAKRSKVFLDDGSFEVVERIRTNANRPSAPPDLFWAQMSYWLQLDLARAIAEANAGAKDVTESTVKHIVNIDLPETFAQPQATNTAAAAGQDGGYGGDDMPTPAADPSQPIAPNFAISPTGRYSNPLYDVIHFRMSLVVDAERVPMVLQALSRNRFITAYETSISAVDSAEAQSNGYIYGARPVVRLDMQCEALFMRAWTTGFMPPQVKMALGIVDQPVAE
jgi:hypothetical protein